MTKIEVCNPGSGQRVGEVALTTAQEVSVTAGRLRAAQVQWECLGARGRRPWLDAFRSWLLDSSEEVVELLVAETGKVRAEARLEVMAAVSLVGYWADHAEGFLRDRRVRSASLLTATKQLSVVHRPHPLVGVISPWNFPVALFLMDAVPALAAGAAVLAKPSEVSPLTARLLEQGWTATGAPPVLAVVTGEAETGEALVDAVDYVQFTGSTATGRRIAQAAAARLKPYGLELGGKDAAIVCADADLDRAVNGIAWGAFFNAGQVCVSIERVYVEAPVYDTFLERLAAKVRSIIATDMEVEQIGAMATPAQLALVERHVADAVAKGARVLTGGAKVAPGLRYPPTLLADVDHSMACLREETFGPTLPVMKVADVGEAIELTNASDYGLSASVWTRDVEQGRAIGRTLDVGAVNVNDVMSNLFAVPLPHGGWKSSGVGTRQGGAAGLLKYCRQQAVTTPAGPSLRNELTWYPYSPRREAITRRALRAIVGHGVLERIGARAARGGRGTP